MYLISADPAQNLIEVELGGLMTVEAVADYIRELRRVFRDGGFRAGYRILIDVSACAIQSQAMIEAMRAHMVDFPKASRIAMVTGSSLARMQIRRLMTQSYARVFATHPEGRGWLLLDDRSVA